MNLTSTLKNGHHGKSVETSTSANGYDWEIHTSKTSGGKIRCYAQAGIKGNGSFSYAMFSDPNINLITEAGHSHREKFTAHSRRGPRSIQSKICSRRAAQQNRTNRGRRGNTGTQHSRRKGCAFTHRNYLLPFRLRRQHHP